MGKQIEYPADTVDADGVVHPTVGDNIRYGSKEGAYTLPVATKNTLGGVKIHDSTWSWSALAQTVRINSDNILYIRNASGTTSGVVNPVIKTDDMTGAVGIDTSTGRLYAATATFTSLEDYYDAIFPTANKITVTFTCSSAGISCDVGHFSVVWVNNTPLPLAYCLHDGNITEPSDFYLSAKLFLANNNHKSAIEFSDLSGRITSSTTGYTGTFALTLWYF